MSYRAGVDNSLQTDNLQLKIACITEGRESQGYCLQEHYEKIWIRGSSLTFDLGAVDLDTQAEIDEFERQIALFEGADRVAKLAALVMAAAAITFVSSLFSAVLPAVPIAAGLALVASTGVERRYKYRREDAHYSANVRFIQLAFEGKGIVDYRS